MCFSSIAIAMLSSLKLMLLFLSSSAQLSSYLSRIRFHRSTIFPFCSSNDFFYSTHFWAYQRVYIRPEPDYRKLCSSSVSVGFQRVNFEEAFVLIDMAWSVTFRFSLLSFYLTPHSPRQNYTFLRSLTSASDNEALKHAERTQAEPPIWPTCHSQAETRHFISFLVH